MIEVTLYLGRLWLFGVLQAPTTLPDLFWIILSSVLSLLLAAGIVIYKRDWQILTMKFDELNRRLERVELWQRDREP